MHHHKRIQEIKNRHTELENTTLYFAYLDLAFELKKNYLKL